MAMTATPRRGQEAGDTANGSDVLSPSGEAIRCIEAAVEDLVEKGVDTDTVTSAVVAHGRIDVLDQHCPPGRAVGLPQLHAVLRRQNDAACH